MLKIEVWIRDCMEYYHSSFEIPEGLGQAEFEDEVLQFEDPYSDGEVFDTVPYIVNNDLIVVWLEGLEIARFTDLNQFSVDSGHHKNYEPHPPALAGRAALMWGHDVKFCARYSWNHIKNFDPSQIVIKTGTDQCGKIYFSTIDYAGTIPDEKEDLSDVGSGYTDISFYYHKDQVWEA